jgi:nitrogen fixation/metabolism regulation signal transduction histidine kinase
LKPKPHSIYRRFTLMQAGAMALALLLLASGLYLHLMVQGRFTGSLQDLDQVLALNSQVRSALDSTTQSFWRAYYAGDQASEAAQQYQAECSLLQNSTVQYAGLLLPAGEQDTVAQLERAVQALAAQTRLLLAEKTDAFRQAPQLHRVEDLTAQIRRTLQTTDEIQIQALQTSRMRVDSYTRLLSLMLVVFALLAVLALFWFRREHQTQVWEPLESLRQMVLRIGAGDLDVTAQIPRSVELGGLIGGFLQMAGELPRCAIRSRKRCRSAPRNWNPPRKSWCSPPNWPRWANCSPGVAHEINNPLTSVLGFSEIVLARRELDPAIRAQVQIIRDESIRLKNLVANLSSFARRGPIRRRRVDLRQTIARLASLRQYELTADNITLHVLNAPGPVWMLGDPDQLLQVLLNLTFNAEHGVKSCRAAGDIWLEYGVRQDSGFVAVKDNGAGMTAEVQERVFDPFFTTKPVGEGTGLGLATVYGIVKQSDGWIAPISEPGHGATFRIFLPVYEPPVLVAPPAPAPPKGRAAARDLSGVGRILFVEDEDAVRRVAARLLRARGYEVLEAADGEEALVIAEANAGQIDLMISDVIMPGLDGPHLLKEARQWLGDAPVMFISGYAEAEFSKVLEGEVGVSFLAKPIDITVLAEKVKQALQGE